MTEQELVSNLKKNGHKHDHALGFLYKNVNYSDPIRKRMMSKGVAKDDAEILWVDVVTRFATLVRSGKYQDQGNLLGYLHNLSRYIMLNHFKDRKKVRTVELEDGDSIVEDVKAYGLYNIELKKLLQKELDKVGESCKQILSLWSESYSMKEIIVEMNIVSVEAARKRKHICLKNLLSNIESQMDLKSILKSYMELF